MGDELRKTAERRPTRVRLFEGQKPARWEAAPKRNPARKSSLNTKDTNLQHLAAKKWYEQVRTKTGDELVGEYAGLTAKPDAAKRKDWEKMAGAKMRYRAVVLYDETRVVLKDGPAGDFIHASFVDGWGERKRAWIIAMAPLPETFPDFWHMVWQEQVPVVVMLCQLREPSPAGRVVEKCSQYWPAVSGEKLAAGAYSVECEKTYMDPECEGQKIQVSALWLWSKGSRRRVFHYQYQSWGDHGVPTSHKAMVHFSKLVETQWRETAVSPHFKPSSPVLVHCSAGLGRSGTFVAVANAIKGLGAPGFSVMEVVRTIREQRFHAVQNDQQYVYIYQCLVAYLKKSGIIPANSSSPFFTGTANAGAVYWLSAEKQPRASSSTPDAKNRDVTPTSDTANTAG